MAYSDESLKAKLSTLNETQDSIVSVSQWIMFHKRHADRIAAYWLTRLRDSPPAKRLNFIYLVNDIVQNARARKRDEFPNAFSPLMPEAMQTAYRSSTPDIQGKIRRVVDVWRSRSVFEVPIHEAIEARLEEIDKSKGTGKKTLMGNSLFGGASGAGMPKELETLGPLQVAVTKATLSVRPFLDTANAEYEKLNDAKATLPSPPVHAARLSSLLKALANAETSVASSIKARKALIEGLEKILETNRSSLAKEEATYLDLSSRKMSTEAKKREVEDGIMRGLSAENSPSNGAGTPDVSTDRGRAESAIEPERPDFEALTPEATTPVGSPKQQHQHQQPQPPSISPNNPDVQELLAKVTGNTMGTGMPRIRTASGGQGISGLGSKRRKMTHDEDFVPDLGEMGMGAGDDNMLADLDEDVNELLRQEGAKV